MRKKILLLLPALGLIVGAAIVTSCGGDEDPAPPTAKFSYEDDGRVVTFTSETTNATTFMWEFGDGETSTEANPVHEYPNFGEYTVKFSATGAGGTVKAQDDKIVLAKTSAIDVEDGTVADWADVPVAFTSSDAASGTITKVKIDYNAQNIFLYVEGTANLRGFFDVYIDTDADSSSGYFSGWYPLGFGADYFTEGYFAVDHDAPIFSRQAGFENTDWAGWKEVLAVGETGIAASDLLTVGAGKAIEIKFTRASFTNLSTKGFSIAVVDVSEGWATLGALPIPSTETSKMHFFDLTK